MALLISNLVDYDMNIQEAIDAPPRVNNYEKGKLKIESRIPTDVQEALTAKGHTLNVKKPSISTLVEHKESSSIKRLVSYTAVLTHVVMVWQEDTKAGVRLRTLA